MNKKRKRRILPFISDDGLEELKGMGSAALIIALFLIFSYGLSWILICGLIWLICLCFSLEFKWLIATGIWLIWCALSSSLFRG